MKYTPGQSSIQDESGRDVFRVITGNPNISNPAALAARLFACWNACEGISTEALNAGAVDAALSASKELLNRVDLVLVRGYVGAGIIDNARNQLVHVGK